MTDASSPLSGSDIHELARALRRRRLSAVELATWTLDRLGRIGPRLNALATRTPRRALAEAQRADRRIAAGGAEPLLGVPYGVKDLIDAEDTPSERPDAAVVGRLRRAGAVLTAKLAIENAGGGWARLAAVTAVGGDGRRAEASAAGPFGFGVNPWDATRWSGGSSSGSASVVAAGLLPFSLGIETAGSVVGPAAFCGLSAVRPTFGRVSARGAVPEAWTLDKIGVFAHSADDCAGVLALLTGGRAGAEAFDHALLRRPARARLRLGFAEEDFIGAHPSAGRALARGLDEMRAMGPTLVRAVIRQHAYGALVDTVMRAEGATTFHALIAGGRLGALVTDRQRPGIEGALSLPAHVYLTAQRERAEIAAEFAALFTECDALLAPAQPRTAPTLAEMIARTSAGPSAAPERAPGNGALTSASNLAGLPAVVVPCGPGSDGLPVGLQLVGPPRSEPLLLGLAAAYQRATGHHLSRAPLVGAA